MQGPGQRLSGWRGRGFEGPVRERGRLQTVQGRTDGHAAPRLRARAGSGRAAAAVGRRVLGAVGSEREQQRELRNMKGRGRNKAKASGPPGVAVTFFPPSTYVAFAL
ncbi:hypothetical protein SETIT_9G148200v2 [Setaria italica]|uniref:Uncharacterized protein n=2 Tax=Setaria TaxID=4554 RepID=A0A368SGT6_SETIT|nr:hypothetical protein SETIT_9G148200v2 [Setaria italica]TKV92173.1 hypothetical protein SEVIR_9G146700v2 [Setaria viridis]